MHITYTGMIWGSATSVYIITEKKRLCVHGMHIVLISILYIILVVFCGLPGSQEKDDSARDDLDILSHVGMSAPILFFLEVATKHYNR